MKAIIIRFEGTIRNEEALMGAFAHAMSNYVTVEDDPKVVILTDQEVDKAIINIVIVTKEPVSNSHIEVIREFCKRIIKEIGSPTMKTQALLNQDICKFLVNQNRETIAAAVNIIANIDTTAKYIRHRKLLQEYGLACLPSLLRDINPLFNSSNMAKTNRDYEKRQKDSKKKPKHKIMEHYNCKKSWK